MKDKLYYIRGNASHPDRAKAMLQQHYPDADFSEWNVDNPNLLYYVGEDGLTFTLRDGADGEDILKTYGEELYLKRFPDDEDEDKEDWLKGKERCVFVKESGDLFMYLPHDAPKEERLFPRGGLNVVHLLSPSDVYLDLRRKSDTADMNVNGLKLAPAEAIEDWNDFFLHPNHLHYSRKDRCMKRWFNPFDKVLVRNFDDCIWFCDVFSHYGKPVKGTPFPSEVFKCIGGARSQCLLFTEVTEPLVGTTRSPIPNQL